MISISSFNNNYMNKSQSFSGCDISDLLFNGDKALNQNKFEEALKYYKQANQNAPDDERVYKKLAKTQFHLKDYSSSEQNYLKYLEKNQNDTDIIIELGETQRQAGLYEKALKNFEKAYELDSANDLAKRSIFETKNNIKSLYSPNQAQQEKSEYAAKNLQDALNMTVQYMTPDFMKELSDVKIMFGKTASMGGTANIAQYENAKKTITVSDSYIYAAPQVIAAYLSHECIHAKDADAYTSVREEQDAYEVAAKFWMKNSNGVKDPEMDYTVELYKKSAADLRNRVEEIYTMRDPSISKTSPNHPPQKFFHFNTYKQQNHASQSLNQYNVIA